jgi:integrase
VTRGATRDIDIERRSKGTDRTWSGGGVLRAMTAPANASGSRSVATRRRGRGEGGLRQKTDGRWEASIDLGYVGGKRCRKFVYGRTKADALDKLRREQQRISEGLAPSDGRQSTKQFLEWWYEVVLPGTVSDGSYDTYGWLMRSYLIPALGRIRLTDLTPARVTEMMRAMAEGQLTKGRPLSPQTQNAARKLLSKALRRAEQEGLIFRNAAALCDGPRLAQREGRSLTKDEAKLLLAKLGADRLGAAYCLQLALGLRKGEVLGLAWSHVDLSAEVPVAHIRQQLQRRPQRGLTLSDLKTPKSRRDLVLPLPVVLQLRAWKTKQATEQLAAGPHWQNIDGLVFTTPSGTPIDPNNFCHRLSRLTKGAGLGHWTTHELRHSAGSLLFDAGVPMKLISELMGHSSERVTSDIYVHPHQGGQIVVATAMADALWGTPV